MQTVKTKNEKGFTLVEVLVALLVLTVGMLAIFEGLVMYMTMNLNNLCRDEAVKIAEEKINYLRSIGSSPGSGSEIIRRRIRDFNRNFLVNWDSNAISKTSYTIRVSVSWNISGKEYTHSALSILTSGD